jgi:hypothetical protein
VNDVANLPDSQKPSDQPLNGASRELKPMEVDLSRIVLLGTVLYALAAMVMLPLQTSLTHSGHGRWPWTAVSGVALGLMGLYYVKRRDRAIARDRARAAAEAVSAE